MQGYFPLVPHFIEHALLPSDSGHSSRRIALAHAWDVEHAILLENRPSQGHHRSQPDLEKCLGQMGMTPSSRASLYVPQTKELSPFASL